MRSGIIRSRRWRIRYWIGSVAAATVFLGGCTEGTREFFKTDRSRLLSPDKLVNRRAAGAPINPIYSSVGPTDVSQELVPNATFPAEGDWTYEDTDYVIGPTDVVNVSILDLYQEGLETVLQRQVSTSGYIDLPLLTKRIKAEGLTASQLTDAIINAYRPDILKSPIVSVTMASERQSTFAVVGAVARPQIYNIIRKDMRLLDAIAMAGGISQVNIRYVYVIRPAPAIRRSVDGIDSGELPELPAEAPPEEPEAATQGQDGQIDIEEALRILGGGEGTPGTDESYMPSYSEVSTVAAANGAPPAGSRPRWIYRDGQWIQVQPEPAQPEPVQPTPVQPAPQIPAAAAPAPAGEPEVATRPAPMRTPQVQTPPQPGEPEDPFGWRKLDQSQMARIIAINLPELEAGNQRMNIIVRDNDIIQVPTLQVGEFYIMGEVARPGPYSLTGRRVTVKMAVAAAGNLGALAWPENSILIRRVGDDQEQIFPLDLEAIFLGEQPDFFLKPNDVIAVGTDVRSSFYAVVRNAFRMTYGFGFIWDRNFAEGVVGLMDSRRFTRW